MINMEFGYVNVNIYNKDRILIPLLGRRDPVIKNLGIGVSLYRRLKQIPGIEVYTVQEDAQRLQSQVAPATQPIVKVEIVAEKVQEVELKETISEVILEVQTDVIVDQNNLDALIEEKLEELPEEEVEDIVLTEEDFEEIAEHNSIKKYEQSVLEGMTKAQLKEILNVERGFEPGHKYYGGYHDTQSTLVGYVLNSQK